MVFEFAEENRRSKQNRVSGVPMKKLIDEEFSKDVNARHTSPGAVGRLMGLDSLPSFGAHSQHRYTRSHAHLTPACSSHDRYGFSQDIAQRRSTDDMPDVKDVFEVMEATRLKVRRSPISRNGNGTSRFDMAETADLDYIRQKFMDAKRHSTNESLQNSEELNETLDALVSNKDLLLEFFQKLDPIVKRDLQDASASSTANCITILKPSRRNQSIGTDNVYTNGTETFFRTQKEVKHSTRKPHAKLYGQSPTEDSGSLRQKLLKSSHLEISDKRVSPTRIVVLKPSLEKAQDTEGAFALTHEILNLDYRRHKASQDTGIWSPYTEESVSLGDSKTLGHITKGCREIARDVTKQMRTARGSGSRKQVLKYNTNTFGSDERSQFMSPQTKLKTSEAFHRPSELCDGWASSSSDSHETSTTKEAKKHLSNRWKKTRQYQHQARENNISGVLADMFALSDQEASTVSTQAMPWVKYPKGELHRDRMPGSYSNPLGISSNDGWRDVVASNLTRSKSLSSSINHGVHRSSNRKRTGRHNEFSMLKDVLKVGPHDFEYACRSRQRKSLVRGSSFDANEADLVSPDNEERMMIEREIHVSSEEPTNVIVMSDSSEQTLAHTVGPGQELDAVCHLDTISTFIDQKKEHGSPARLNQEVYQQPLTALDCPCLVPSPDNLVIQDEGIEQHLDDDDYPDVLSPPTGSESPAGICHHQDFDNKTIWNSRTESESPVSPNSDEQPSPVSVLESSVDADDVYSGDFERVSADLQGLRKQLRLLKMEATDNTDGTILSAVSDDEIASTSQPLPEMEILSAFRDEEERDFSYVFDLLILLGIDAANQDEVVTMCYFSECPAPHSYDILENKYNSLILWPSSERKLLFDLTNDVIKDIVSTLVHRGSTGLLCRFSSWWGQEGFVEEVWQMLVKIRHDMERIQGCLMMDLEWLGSEDGNDLVRSEMGEMLLEDLVEESIAEFMGVTISGKLCG